MEKWKPEEGRKLRVGDTIEVIGEKEVITLTEPSPEERLKTIKRTSWKRTRCSISEEIKQRTKKDSKPKKKRISGSLFVSQEHNMWLKSIHIQKFRNYKEVDLQFHSGLNIFLGQNAQGKTNLLESIYF